MSIVHSPFASPDDNPVLDKSVTFVTSITDADEPVTSPSLSPSPSSPNTSQRGLSIEVEKLIAGTVGHSAKEKQWYILSKGLWLECDDNKPNQHIIKVLDTLMKNKYPYSMVGAIKNFIRDTLRIDNFTDSRYLLPVKNGVLNLKYRSIEPYGKYRYRWQLPYDYQSDATCPTVLRYLMTATGGDRDLIKFLIAWMVVVLHGRYEIQKYLELIGDGGTGKSTFLDLCTLLVGEENRMVTDLKSLNGNRFESSNLLNKRLTLITDSRFYGEDMSVVKAITGGDAIRNEKKGKQAGSSFIYKGLVMIAANENIQTTDHTSGLARRRITIPFNARATDKEKARYKGGIIEAMKPQMSGLLNLLLQQDIQKAINIVSNPQGTLKKIALNAELETNPILAWMNDRLTRCNSGESFIGGGRKKTDTPDDLIKAENEKLYPNYLGWCEEQGKKPVASQKFSSLIEDMARRHDIDTERKKTNKGVIFAGLRLRKSYEISPLLLNSDEVDSKSDEAKPESDGQTPVSDEDDEGDGVCLFIDSARARVVL